MADEEQRPASGGEEASTGEAKPKAARPPRAERAAEKKAPARQSPPPGSIADLFAEVLPDVHFEAYQALSHVVLEINRDDLPKVMRAAKEDPRLDMKFLRTVFGVDHLDDGFEVVYQLASYTKGHEVAIKTRVPRDDPRVPSVTPIWQGANWHERETRDMFGIVFEGHPHLVPLLLPEDMTDHFPLRKDNPLAEIEEWQAEKLEAYGGGDEGGGNEE